MSRSATSNNVIPHVVEGSSLKSIKSGQVSSMSHSHRLPTPDQTLHCPICKVHLKNPRVLPCLHSFCLECLQDHVGQEKLFPCPVCRQVVRLEANSGVDSLPVNTFFGILDLADSSGEPPHNEDLQKSVGSKMSPVTAQKISVESSQSSVVKRTPLRQPFFSSGAMVGIDVEKPLSQELLGQLSPYPSVWTSGNHENNIWKNKFDFRSSADTSPTGSELPKDISGWQKLDSGDPDPLRSAFANVIGATAVTPTNPAMSTWSSVVGSNRGPPGFSKPSSKVPTCSCEDKQVITSRCRDCNEDLCDSCVDAHQRVSLTRNHVIVRYPETSNTLVAVSSPNPMTGFSATPLFGFPRESDVFKVYTDAVEKAKADCEKLMTKAKHGCTQIEETKLQVTEMESLVEKRFAVVYTEIQTKAETYITEIQARAKELLTRLENIHKVKLATLAQQKRELTSTSVCLAKVADQLAACSISGREMDLINSCNLATSTIKEAQIKCGSLAIHEDPFFQLELPGPDFLKTLASYGFIGGSAFAPNSYAEGDGLKKATLGKDARFVVCVCDQLNEQRHGGGDPLRVVIVGPDGRPTKVSVSENANGTYRIVWLPNVEGDHLISVTIKDIHIKESPFRVKVRTGRNYNSIGVPIFTFGSEGEKEGDLCRPWGVCCSREGLIIVANRSNNRIEVFNTKGVYQYKFGTAGKLNGQFDRPSSVCCDNKNRVIVADKDNHRIQVFTVDGKFLMTFGEKGSKPGQFNYPWDVACNSKDQILVSDTRNHRIQLFSSSGEYLNKYGFEGAMWKHFDSPRGVCFTTDDQAVVTDFNNHRLLVIRSDFQGAQFLGKEGNDSGSFNRPNGVAVDEEGYIIVADSRNDRIQIFSPSGVFVKQFGTKGTNLGEFDRPSGICVSPDGLIIVVDFGNNRVQVF